MTLNFGQSGKYRSNTRQYGTKKLSLTICRKLLVGLLYELGDQTVKAGKIVGRKVSSLTSWIADKYSNRQEASQQIKIKSNESRLPDSTKLKFQPENSAEKITLPKTQLKLNENLKIEEKIPPVNSGEKTTFQKTQN